MLLLHCLFPLFVGFQLHVRPFHDSPYISSALYYILNHWSLFNMLKFIELLQNLLSGVWFSSAICYVEFLILLIVIFNVMILFIEHTSKILFFHLLKKFYYIYKVHSKFSQLFLYLQDFNKYFFCSAVIFLFYTIFCNFYLNGE